MRRKRLLVFIAVYNSLVQLGWIYFNITGNDQFTAQDDHESDDDYDTKHRLYRLGWVLLSITVDIGHYILIAAFFRYGILL